MVLSIDEGSSGLHDLSARPSQDLSPVLKLQRRLQVGRVEVGPHDLLGHLHAEGRVAADQLRQLHRPIDDESIGDDVGDDTELECLRGVYLADCQHQLECTGCPDETGERVADPDVTATEKRTRVWVIPTLMTVANIALGALSN